MSILGTVMPRSLIQKQLYDMNKDYTGNQIWKSAYDAISSQENAALYQAKSVYDSDIAQAYLASQQLNRNIYGGNAFDSTRQYLADENRANLAKAYESFRQNYQSNVSKIQSTAAESRTAIDKALAQETDYTKQFVDILNSGEYLNWVAENSPDVFSDTSAYRQDLIDLGALKQNEDGTYVQSTGDLFGVENGTIDSDGNLTEKGKNLYRFMLNMGMKGEGYSLTNYLESNKNYQELSKWLTSQGTNQYGSNYEMVLNDILGIDSDDARYVTGVHDEDFYTYSKESQNRLNELHDMGRIDDATYEKYQTLYDEQSFRNSATNYTINSAGGDRFRIQFEGEKKWRSGKYAKGAYVNDELQTALDDFYGDAPDVNTLTLYKNTLYIYDKDGWRKVNSTTQYDVSDAINKYKNI